MADDLLPGTTNVVRFPVEERGRPTLDLMRFLAPDVRTLDMLAGAYELDLPMMDFRDRVDAGGGRAHPQPSRLRTRVRDGVCSSRAMLEPLGGNGGRGCAFCAARMVGCW